jgi:hypothetical protein
MGFQKGELVQIVDNRGPDNGYSNNTYYYSEGVDQVPPESFGWVEKTISNAEIIVRISKRFNGRFHPAEIQYPFASNGRPIHHPIFELAKECPVYLVDGRVYLQTSDKIQDLVKTWLSWGRRSLSDIGSYEDMDELLMNRSYSHMESFRQRYLEKIISRLPTMVRIEVIDTPQMIYRDIFPYLSNEVYNDKISELLGKSIGRDGANKNGRKLDEICSRVIGEFESEKDRIIGSSASPDVYNELRLARLLGDEVNISPKILLSAATKKRNIALRKGKVRELIEKEDGRISIGGRHFSLGHKLFENDSAVLEREMASEIYKMTRIDTLNIYASKDRIRELLAGRDLSLESIAGSREIDKDGYGFTSFDGQYYVYVDVPAFAIKSQYDNNVYLFSKTRIGIKVMSEKGSMRYHNEFVMIDNNNHPFLHLERSNYARICTGNQSFPDDGSSTGEIISKRLRLCRNLLMYGYLSLTYHPKYQLRQTCSDCGQSHFLSNMVSEYQAIKLGVPIIEGGRKVDNY